MSAALADGGAPAQTDLDPDAELLAACSRFQAADTARETEGEAGGITDERGEELDIGWEDALDEVCALRPQTLAGMRARAEVAFLSLKWKVSVMPAKTWQEQAKPWDRVALESLSDFLAPPAANAADAELISICKRHVENMHAFNQSAAAAYESDPLWLSYSATLDAIDSATPQTIGGVLAMARAAHAEGKTGLDGGWKGSRAEAWAPKIINALLRMHGEG